MNFTVEKTIDNLARIVIPKSLRDYYGITLGEKIVLVATDGGILITKTNQEKNTIK